MRYRVSHCSSERHARRVAAAVTVALLSFGINLSSAAAAGDPARGKETVALWCSSCHQIGPEYPVHGPGPPFMRIGRDVEYSPQFIRDWVTYPHTQMPHFRFSPQVLDDIVAYIESFRDETRLAMLGAITPSAGGAATGPETTRYASGSGFYVDAAGHILTAAHVLDKCGRITVGRPGHTQRVVRTVQVDPALDLALLKAKKEAAAHATFSGEATLAPGDRVVSFGFPLSGMLSSDGNLSVGYIAALAGVNDNPDQFQMSAELQFGSSGGPVLDSWGRVVGLAVSRLVSMQASASSPHGINFATTSTVIRLFLGENGVIPDTAPRGRTLTPTELAAIARGFTVRVACWR